MNVAQEKMVKLLKVNQISNWWMVPIKAKASDFENTKNIFNFSHKVSMNQNCPKGN